MKSVWNQWALRLLVLLPLAAVLGLFGDGAASRSEAYDTAGLQPKTVIGQAIGVTSITPGPDPNAPPLVAVFTGLIGVKKWPQSGFVHGTLPDGRHELTTELLSQFGNQELARHAEVSGLGPIAASLSTDIQSPGTITQQNPGQDFPAEVRFDLFLKVETPFGTLHNEEAIILEATTDSIPPLVSPFPITDTTPPAVVESQIASLGGVNVFVGTNLPVALLDDSGNTLAFFTPQIHSTVLVGVCADGIDSDGDGSIDEEEPNNLDDDGDGLIDEDSKCPPPVGGTTDLPTDDSADPTEGAGSSGNSTLPIAAAAGLLVVLAGGGLFVRRRFMR